jgi:hypothetical protein
MKTIFVVLLLAISFNAQAKNPGELATSCVDASSSNGKVTFKNNCGVPVFVIWCGDLTYSKKRCGDGPKGAFYTQSTNINAGDKQTTDIKGQYNYAACKGSISFGNDGEYVDTPSGGIKCLVR